MNQNLFNFVLTLLGKITNKSSFEQKNSKNQNLLHIFAIRGNRSSVELKQKIYRELIKGTVDPSQKDVFNRISFHYACLNQFEFLIDELLKLENIDLNLLDCEGQTPFSIYFIHHWRNLSSLNVFVSKGADTRKKFMVRLFFSI